MQDGDQEAIAYVWEACWQPVVNRARSLLNDRFRSVSDEEDIASAVLESVLMRAQAGDFSALNNSNSLWRLLWLVVERKVSKHVEHHLAARRNVQKTIHISNLSGDACDNSRIDAANSGSMEAIALAETLELLMLRLSDPVRLTAVYALAGHSPKEISNLLNIKVWAVYNHLTYIRAMIEKIDDE